MGFLSYLIIFVNEEFKFIYFHTSSPYNLISSFLVTRNSARPLVAVSGTEVPLYLYHFL